MSARLRLSSPSARTCLGTISFNSPLFVNQFMSDRETVGELLEALQTGYSSGEIGVLPEVLEGIDQEQTVCVARLDAELNLNAIAIGLGLENVRYEPEQFPGLVYISSDEDVPAVLLGTGVIIVPTNQAGDPTDFIRQVVEKLERIGLYEGESDAVSIETETVADVISRS